MFFKKEKKRKVASPFSMNVSYRIFPEGSIINTRPCVHEERTMIWLKAKEEKKNNFIKYSVCYRGILFSSSSLSCLYFCPFFSRTLAPSFSLLLPFPPALRGEGCFKGCNPGSRQGNDNPEQNRDTVCSPYSVSVL